MIYNRFDASNFIYVIQDMQKSVHNEMLAADLQQLIDLTSMAAETHEMEYANKIYKILHDLDYFLLRYGIEDVGKYTKDGGVVSKYYGVKSVVYHDRRTVFLTDLYIAFLIKIVPVKAVFIR